MSTYDTPGSDVIERLIDDIVDPIEVTDMVPYDLSGIRDPGMQALISLATACKWNVMRKPNKPIILTARDGVRLSMPTNTSIRFSVFLQRLNAIARHSQTVVITSVLIEKIIAATKVDSSHARAMRNIVGVPPQEIQEVEEEEQLEEEPSVLLREPVYQNSASIKRTWTNNDVDFECTYCGAVFPSVQACNGHYSGHVRRGETTEPPQRPKADITRQQRLRQQRAAAAIAAGREPGRLGRPPKKVAQKEEAKARRSTVNDRIPSPAGLAATNGAPVATYGIEYVAGLVQDLIDAAVHKAQAEMTGLLAEAQAEIDRLVAERAALRDLLS